ncbi:MAG: recombinase family protein [Lentisphaeria bacterium]|nr:recombinase family protein [Lentisphaeria bacterium]
MSTKKEKKCLIYARQSSGKESESESIAMQLKNCRQLAQQRGLQIVGEYHDHNSSGRLYPTGAEELEKHDGIFHAWYQGQTSDKRYRAGLGELLQKLSSVRYVIVDDLTRLARPLSGSYLNDYLKQLFQQSGVLLLTVKNGPMDYGNYMDCLVSDVQTHIVDNQLKIQTQKSRAALMELKRNGYYPTSPKMFGIEYIGGKNRNVKVKKECVEVIRYINHEIRNGHPFNALVREINRRYRHLFKTVCYPSTLRHIAQQPFYAGYMYDPEGNLIAARQMKGKAILTLEEWQEACRVLAGRHQERKPHQGSQEYPFSGLLYCGNCGARLVAGNDHGKIYYFCRTGTQILQNEGCRHSRLNVTLLRKSRKYHGLQDAILPLLQHTCIQENDPELPLQKRRQILLSPEEYGQYLRKCIIRITSYQDHIIIQTQYGDIPLRRTLSHGNRNFPDFRYWGSLCKSAVSVR